MSENKRPRSYDPRIIYNPKTDTIAIFAKDCIWNGVASWFYYDGKKCKNTNGKRKLPKDFVEVAYFPEGTL